jgi:hypothetical protein
LSNQPQESRRKGLNLRLFSHIKDEGERKAVMSAWEGSSVLFDKTLRKVLLDKLQESYDAIDSDAVYELPDRVGYLTDQCGYRRALKELIMLLPTNN